MAWNRRSSVCDRVPTQKKKRRKKRIKGNLWSKKASRGGNNCYVYHRHLFWLQNKNITKLIWDDLFEFAPDEPTLWRRILRRTLFFFYENEALNEGRAVLSNYTVIVDTRVFGKGIGPERFRASPSSTSSSTLSSPPRSLPPISQPAPSPPPPRFSSLFPSVPASWCKWIEAIWEHTDLVVRTAGLDRGTDLAVGSRRGGGETIDAIVMYVMTHEPQAAIETTLSSIKTADQHRYKGNRQFDDRVDRSHPIYKDMRPEGVFGFTPTDPTPREYRPNFFALSPRPALYVE